LAARASREEEDEEEKEAADEEEEEDEEEEDMMEEWPGGWRRKPAVKRHCNLLTRMRKERGAPINLPRSDLRGRLELRSVDSR
jgi:hypothetical protein